jgi:hypothetical protein
MTLCWDEDENAGWEYISASEKVEEDTRVVR